MKQIITTLYNHNFIRYVFVGGTSFILDFGVLVLLHEPGHASLLVAASVSYWLAITYNFLLNRYWTFGVRDLEKIHHHMFMYGLLLAFNYLFTLIFLNVTTGLGLHYTVAKIIAVAIQISWTYLAYKKIIFK